MNTPFRSPAMLILAFCLALAVTAPLAAQQSVEDPPMAPNFTLTDSHGNNHSLTDYRGKFVVLEWLNHGCPFVKKQYDSESMQALQEEFTGQDVVWLSIVSSAPGKQGYCTPDEANALTEEKGASPTAVLLDTDGAVGHLYDAKTTPHMMVIDPDGHWIYNGAIDDVRTTDPEVEAETNFVAQALNEAMSGQPVSVSRTQPYGCPVKY